MTIDLGSPLTSCVTSIGCISCANGDFSNGGISIRRTAERRGKLFRHQKPSILDIE